MADQPKDTQQEELVEFAADIVSAYVSNNPVQQGDLPELIQSVYTSMAALASANGEAQAEAPTPAVSIKSSVKKDHIVCLECGKKFKSLKRHLATNHDMLPEDYREKWGLSSTYPMVAPNYAEQRSEMAKQLGLGRKPTAAKAKRRGRD